MLNERIILFTSQKKTRNKQTKIILFCIHATKKKDVNTLT